MPRPGFRLGAGISVLSLGSTGRHRLGSSAIAIIMTIAVGGAMQDAVELVLHVVQLVELLLVLLVRRSLNLEVGLGRHVRNAPRNRHGNWQTEMGHERVPQRAQAGVGVVGRDGRGSVGW